VLRLPATVESTDLLDERLGRPPGWLARRAGIQRRHIWAEEDPVGAAGEAARSSLSRAGLLPEEVGALLVASAAPPLLAGLAAAIHTRAGLSPRTPALEVGGACAGFLSALWLARSLAGQAGTVLIVCVEAPTRVWGCDDPAAALFGDAAAVCLVHDAPPTGTSLPLIDIGLEIDPAGADLLRVQKSSKGGVRLRMKGCRLAGSAVEAMAAAVEGVVRARRWDLKWLAGVAVHGGNGRLPRLVARRLGLPEDRVWSRTAVTGNLGSASLMAAWVAHEDEPGPVAWAAVGPGLTCAWALTGPTLRRPPVGI
jgi:3-oxoacyl-[acyl-carrier-protein] synthase-3